MENNYQLSRIHNYIHGLMSREEMHALEREALEDPFLQDAIDGYRLQNGVDAKSLSLLQQRLEKQLAQHAQEKNRYFFGWQRLAIGLVAAVMFITVCILLFIRHLPRRAANNVTQVELMDEVFTTIHVRSLPGSDAVPVGGWESFSTFLADHYSGSNTQRTLSLTFRVDGQGHVYDVQLLDAEASQISEEVVRIMTSGPKWKGETGRIEIQFPE